MPKRRLATSMEGEAPAAVPPKRLHPDSWPTRLVEMEVGETESSTTRLDAETATWPIIHAETDKMRRSLSSVVSKARKRLPEGQWTVASGDFRTPSGDVIVVCAVTRTA